mmetsp:Transcript_20611/g.45415  ORF Transcript_20611/g.45415 Transcript_20611/m.45415 type:complete len:313 (-) Transcript_20611:1021-1959(-)
MKFKFHLPLHFILVDVPGKIRGGQGHRVLDQSGCILGLRLGLGSFPSVQQTLQRRRTTCPAVLLVIQSLFHQLPSGTGRLEGQILQVQPRSIIVGVPTPQRAGDNLNVFLLISDLNHRALTMKTRALTSRLLGGPTTRAHLQHPDHGVGDLVGDIVNVVVDFVPLHLHPLARRHIHVGQPAGSLLPTPLHAVQPPGVGFHIHRPLFAVAHPGHADTHQSNCRSRLRKSPLPDTLREVMYKANLAGRLDALLRRVGDVLICPPALEVAQSLSRGLGQAGVQQVGAAHGPCSPLASLAVDGCHVRRLLGQKAVD